MVVVPVVPVVPVPVVPVPLPVVPVPVVPVLPVVPGLVALVDGVGVEFVFTEPEPELEPQAASTAMAPIESKDFIFILAGPLRVRSNVTFERRRKTRPSGKRCHPNSAHQW